MPKRPRSHELEELSINQLRIAFTNAGCIVENLHHDYGEDLIVRVFRNNKATSESFFIQAKATETTQKYMRRDGKSLSFPIKRHHIEHWEKFWEPVILTLWDAKTNTTYWEFIQTFTESYEGQKALKRKSESVSVVIPSDNKLDENGVIRILARTQSRFQRLHQEQEGANVLIGLLEENLGIKIEYNPQAGLLSITQPDGKLEFVAFGKTLAKLEQLEIATGKNKKEIIENAIKDTYELVISQPEDGSFIETNANGEIIKYKSMYEWWQSQQREIEINEYRKMLDKPKQKKALKKRKTG
jgi:hypothetical protein